MGYPRGSPGVPYRLAKNSGLSSPYTSVDLMLGADEPDQILRTYFVGGNTS
jgi:hypothetical protein